MTSAGGRERLDNKSALPFPLPHWREIEKLSTKLPPPPLNTAANSKIDNLNCVFLKKYLDNFLNKNMLNQHNISFQFYLRRFSLNCRFHVVNNAQSQITLIKYVILACNLTLCVKYDLKTAI
jgi:hypothetical protein